MTDFIIPPTIAEGAFVRAGVFNQILRDDLSLAMHRLAYKAADTSRNSTTTPTDDPDLQFALGIDQLWYVDVFVKWRAATSTTPDFKVQFAAGTDSDVYLSAYGINTSDLFVHARVITPIPTSGVTSSSSWQALADDTRTINFQGLVYSVSPATFRVQWAQNTSNADNVTVKIGSNIMGVNLGVNPKTVTT